MVKRGRSKKKLSASATSYTCPWCFESIEAFPDVGGGEHQTYVEDCSVCCHPNVLSVAWNDDEAAFDVSAERES